MNDITWFHRIKLSNGTYTPGVCHHGPDGGIWPTIRFGLPEKLNDITVLDIGSWDGFFSFEAEKRGAIVDAMDATLEDGGNWGATKGFQYAHKDLNSKVNFFEGNIETYTQEKQYNLVLFFGVLYHLKNPTLGLENACKLSNKTILIETAISNKNNNPNLEFRPGHLGDTTNYYYPNILWLEQELNKNGFKCEVIYNDEIRATVRGMCE